MIHIRVAEQSEMPWINSCYDEVKFVHSNFEKEIIAIAEYEGQKAGLGRLVKIGPDHLELGGMYVFPAYQKKGIAGAIVDFLLSHVRSFQTVYCIPFQHLLSFYKKYGFVECADLQSVPEDIIKKYQWCQEEYCTATSLLVKR